MSKIGFESLWLQNYKRERISFTFNFFFLRKQLKERAQSKKQYVPRNWVMFLFNSAPQKPTQTSSEITDGVPQQSMWKTLNAELQASENFWYISFWCTFFLKIFQKEDAIQKAVPFQKLGYFFSKLHATEAHKDLWDYRRDSRTIIVKKSERAITS